MPASFAIEDDGFLEVTIGSTTLQVDSYEAYHHLLAAHAQAADELPDGQPAQVESAFLAKAKAYLSGLGFGAVSTRAADKFASALFAAVEAQKKTDPAAPTPA